MSSLVFAAYLILFIDLLKINIFIFILKKRMGRKIRPLATLWICDLPAKKGVMTGLEVMMVTSLPCWSYDHTSGAQQYGCIYGCLQQPVVMFTIVWPKARSCFIFLAELGHGKQWICLTTSSKKVVKSTFYNHHDIQL